MQCPRCEKELVRQTIEQAGVTSYSLMCPGCGGQWFEEPELQRIADIVEVRMVELRRLPDPETQMHPLVCPHCGDQTTLSKVVNERDQHVIMDVCHTCHGIWLDGGELEAIQEEGLLTATINFWKWMAQQV